jgi:hypothetical protein
MAVLNVTVPDAAVSRIRAAAGRQLGLPGSATTAQVEGLCRIFLRGLCVAEEARLRGATVQSDAETTVAAEFP